MPLSLTLLPVSAPGGILTLIVSFTEALPLPLQAVHALDTTFPLPLQVGHGWLSLNAPLLCLTDPEPLH